MQHDMNPLLQTVAYKLLFKNRDFVLESVFTVSQNVISAYRYFLTPLFNMGIFLMHELYESEEVFYKMITLAMY